MIGLIPFVKNDYLITVIYIGIILISFFFIKPYKIDFTLFILGFFMMIISEYFFISTGVEVFIRRSLFGTMPVWLPFLWAYSFVVIGRAIEIIKN